MEKYYLERNDKYHYVLYRRFLLIWMYPVARINVQIDFRVHFYYSHPIKDEDIKIYKEMARNLARFF